MRITHEHTFDATTDEVSAMLADHDYAVERGASSGAKDSTVDVEGTVADGFTVTIRQAVPADSIPAEFQSFVGSDLTMRYTEVWEPAHEPARHGTFAVEIFGAPGHASGSLEITPSPDGSLFAINGAVAVRVPLFGSMIEKAVSEAVLSGLRHQLAAADAWLARSA